MHGATKMVFRGLMAGILVATGGCGFGATALVKIPVSGKPHNGMVASYRLLHPSNLPSGVRLYQIYYWSRGVKVEAFLTEPTQPGRYPLVVNLHGGAAWPLDDTHYPLGYALGAMVALASRTAVMLYPEYQGYLNSAGTIRGFKTNVTNTLDAITVAHTFGEIRHNDTYLWGYSMGGGVALMTAERDHHVKAVVAVSPFVGLTDVASWARAHPTLARQEDVYGQMPLILVAYGNAIHSLAYQERSPHPSQIAAPVLLLQGTADPHVVWQTVVLFYHQMEAAHRNVKLVLYPGGDHGLHGRYSAQSNAQILRWFARYGLRLN